MNAKLARRRGQKAARRRKILAERRAAQPVSLADRVQSAAGWPLHSCLIHGDAAASGLCSVFLARRSPIGEVALAAFLVDVYALGVKEVLFDFMQGSEFATFIAQAGAEVPLRPIDPSYGRRLVREAAAYAASLGLRPHRGFAAIERLFGEVRAEDCREEFHFGCDGKPVYVISPLDSASQVARRLDRLTETLGEDGFDATIPIPEEILLTARARADALQDAEGG